MYLTHDPATGVFRPEVFLAFAPVIASQTRRRGGSFGLLVVALDSPLAELPEDDPERVAAVAILAGILLRTVRSADLVGRRGPVSFTILAHDAKEAGARRLAGRIRTALRGAQSAEGSATSFTVSIGVCITQDADIPMPELIERAETALAEALAHGGNGTRVSGVAAPELEPAAPPAEGRPEADAGPGWSWSRETAGRGIPNLGGLAEMEKRVRARAQAEANVAHEPDAGPARERPPRQEPVPDAGRVPSSPPAATPPVAGSNAPRAGAAGTGGNLGELERWLRARRLGEPGLEPGLENEAAQPGAPSEPNAMHGLGAQGGLADLEQWLRRRSEREQDSTRPDEPER